MCSVRIPPGSTPFPYTTLFRSHGDGVQTRAIDPSLGAEEVGPVESFAHDLSLVVSVGGDGTFLRAAHLAAQAACPVRSEEHTSELQSPYDRVCRLLLEKKKGLS